MDIKEAERVVIAKPVASRPTCSSFRSFSELLAGAINASPTNSCSETAVAAIRPKTVRFKPGVSRAPTMMVSSQAELPRTAACNSTNKVSESDSKPTLVYKPQAKLVSKTTVSLLANMGNFNTSHQQALLAVEARAQQVPKDSARAKVWPELSQDCWYTAPKPSMQGNIALIWGIEVENDFWCMPGGTEPSRMVMAVVELNR
ncbi:hypothetical protein SLE2022_287590 [Rubroshorea leprosula]